MPLVLSQAVISATQLSATTLPKANLSWRVRAVDSTGNPGAWSTVRSMTVR